MKKKFLVVLERNIGSLPPLLTIIDSIVDNEITILSREYEKDIEDLYSQYDNVNFIYFASKRPYNNLPYMAYFKLKKIFLFRKKFKELLTKHIYDLIWVGSAEAGVQLNTILEDKKYILNIFELYDRSPSFLKKLKPIALNAKRIIVPEVNRGNILRVWFGLKTTPIVIPNKPLNHPLERNLIVKEYSDILNHDKIIIYQGAIGRDRNLDALCEAVSEINGFKLLLMGRETPYLRELTDKFNSVNHIGFVTPPQHLNITSQCYIGVVTYAYFSMNTIFCAPNKIWEYSGFGIPMLANSIPGLINTVGKSKAGLCLNMDNVEEIKKAIIDIDENYEVYRRNSLAMFNSVDVGKELKSVLHTIL